MSSVIFMANAVYPNGTRTVGPFAVPVGIEKMTFSFDRSNWSQSNRKLSVAIEYSGDSGSSWRSLCGFESEGGTSYNDDGSVSTETYLSLFLPDPQSTERMLKATVSISGGSIRTSGTLILE